MNLYVQKQLKYHRTKHLMANNCQVYLKQNIWKKDEECYRTETIDGDKLLLVFNME